MSSGSLSEELSRKLFAYTAMAEDIERIGDHCVNLADLARNKNDRRIEFSKGGVRRARGDQQAQPGEPCRCHKTPGQRRKGRDPGHQRPGGKDRPCRVGRPGKTPGKISQESAMRRRARSTLKCWSTWSGSPIIARTSPNTWRHSVLRLA